MPTAMKNSPLKLSEPVGWLTRSDDGVWRLLMCLYPLSLRSHKSGVTGHQHAAGFKCFCFFSLGQINLAEQWQVTLLLNRLFQERE